MSFALVFASLYFWLCPLAIASSLPNQPISPTIITAPTFTAQMPEPQAILPATPWPKLHIVTEHFPPFQIKHADSLDGWAVQRVQALLAHADLSSEIEVLPWPRAYKIATTRPNTLIFSLLKTEERQPQFHWIAPLCPMHIGFYTSESRADINATTIDGLKPYVIGVERGQANQHYLEKHGFIVDKNLVLVQHKDVLHQMLALGRVDVMLLSQHYVQQWQQQHPNRPTLKPLFMAEDLAQMLYLAAHLDTDPALIAKLTQAWQYLSKQPQSPCPIEML
jgi:ABC-type amino acid transport substrate-binding protein